MAKEESSVQGLVEKITRGELRLPEMQRGYIWKATQVCRLLDSLYRNYPSGTILVWETGKEVSMRETAITQEKNSSYRLLLDGQQRLTSLAAAINGEPITVKGRKKSIEILFNLEHPEHPDSAEEIEDDSNDDNTDTEDEHEESNRTDDLNNAIFAVATDRLERQPQWLKVSEVLKSTSDKEILKNAGIENLEDPNYDKYSTRLGNLRNIRNYIYRIDVLERHLSYEEVTDIFIRINSFGTKLRGSDLALAQITAKWQGSLKIFEKFQQQYSKDFNVEIGTLLRNLVSFATGKSRFSAIGKLSLEELKKSWHESCGGMEYAINFLRSKGIENPILLSSPYILIALALFGKESNYEIEPLKENTLRNWALLANAKGHYSRGSSQSLLDHDLFLLKQGKTEELINTLRKQFGRAKVTAGDIEGLKQNSGIFKTMFLAFKANGAKDWRDNLEISLNHSGSKHKLQYHHIFPKKILKDKGYKDSEINDIANLCFISGKQNRVISDKAPDKYFPEILQKNEKFFDTQCIPHDPELRIVDKYLDFLKDRREKITQCINKFLDV